MFCGQGGLGALYPDVEWFREISTLPACLRPWASTIEDPSMGRCKLFPSMKSFHRPCTFLSAVNAFMTWSASATDIFLLAKRFLPYKNGLITGSSG